MKTKTINLISELLRREDEKYKLLYSEIGNNECDWSDNERSMMIQWCDLGNAIEDFNEHQWS